MKLVVFVVFVLTIVFVLVQSDANVLPADVVENASQNENVARKSRQIFEDIDVDIEQTQGRMFRKNHRCLY